MSVQIHEQIVIDASRDPLVHVLFGEADLHAVRAMFAWAEARFDAEAPYGLMLEWLGRPDLSAGVRNEVGSWMRDRGEALERWCIAQAYVMESVLKRMVLRSVLMLGRNKVQHRVVANHLEAERFIAARLGEQALDIPPAHEAWARTRPAAFE